MPLKTAVSSFIVFVGVMGVFESCAESAVLSGGETSFFIDGTVHTFRSSGTLSVTEAGDVEVLLVGGGGAGGKGKAGGGGAGGVLHKKNFYLEKGIMKSLSAQVGSRNWSDIHMMTNLVLFIQTLRV